MNPNKDNQSTTPEHNKEQSDSVNLALTTIETTEEYISKNISANSEEITGLVDEALVYQADETINEADINGMRTSDELSDIGDRIKAVIVEGAIESTGAKDSNGENPIITLDKSDNFQDLTTAISELHDEDAKLPTGEDIAELAAATIDQEQKEKEQQEPIPETLYRGERAYLGNIDQIGQRDLSTTGHEQTHNQHGKIYLSRDIDYATNYSIGTDGVVWYDHPLPKEEIPIGVVYKIDNPGNIIDAVPEGDPLPDFIGGELAGKHREFTADSIPVGQYQVTELQIMDDFIQPNGHSRSDMRDILERFPVSTPAELPDVIEAVKKRINELDAERNSITR